ncbi:MAG: endolytic transglycosylase MltG [Lachnospiraceae bacterium]|nr:endolytic transglycosylase MltG [Lachnospiraceae bacterium]
MKSGKLVTAVLGAIVKVVVVVVVVFLIYKGATMGYDYGYRIFTEPAMSAGEGRTVQITLKPDMSAMEVGQMMQDKGLCRDAKLFALQYLLSEYKEEIKPGTYEVSTAMTAEEIMAAMVPAKTEETSTGE